MDTEDSKKPDSGQWKFSHLGKRSSGSSSGFSRALWSTALFFRKQLWVWPIVAGLILAVVGWHVHGVMAKSARKTVASKLETILKADVEALKIWFKGQEHYIEALAADDDIQRPILSLLSVASKEGSTAADFLQAPALEELRRELETRGVIPRRPASRPMPAPALEPTTPSGQRTTKPRYNGFAVLDAEGRFLASRRDSAIGRRDIVPPQRLIERVMGGQTVISRPFKSRVMLDTKWGPREGVATMVSATPVRNDDGEIVAVLGLRIRPEDDFTRILQIGQIEESGETYAFDAAGVLISQSRFDDQLKEIGLLPDDEETRSILNIRIRDPGVNMTLGQRPTLRRADQPLTRMAFDAIGGDEAIKVDVDDGYNDYRGVRVVGAWMWLKNYGFGVTTEIDMDEAYEPLEILERTVWGLYALLATSALAILVFTVVVARLNQSARLASLKAQKLGQYTLDEKLGSGAMGIVYRGHHAMLRRPTAIKLLPPERTTESAIARFEREVQMTSRLNHPNTIAIYDYGRTPEGIFYYAMEYLDGIDLDALVKKYGPLPAGRAIYVLRQICGSLAEAHEVGLIHRDVKPANIVLNRRGGLSDVVKVLDFGLVKAVDAKEQSALTMAGAIIGTPLYMAPECIRDSDTVDARSDLYSVGATGYFLVTGKPLFEGKSIVEICNHQVNSSPVRPSERLGREVSRDLEEILLKCLEKNPADRFQTARDVDDALARSNVAASWTESDASAWWNSYAPTTVSAPEEGPSDSDAETVLPPEHE